LKIDTAEYQVWIDQNFSDQTLAFVPFFLYLCMDRTNHSMFCKKNAYKAAKKHNQQEFWFSAPAETNFTAR